MNIRLFLLSIWIPQVFLKKELNNLAEATIIQLNDLLKIYNPSRYQELPKLEFPLRGNLDDIRTKMAQEHNLRVSALSGSLGPEKTVKIARPLMFKTGYELGVDIKNRLGLKDNLTDLVKAAKLLYQVLGIEFEFFEGESCAPYCERCIVIKHCFLAQHYLPLTCQVLSGADEGVVNGLNPQMQMSFKEKITEGAPACVAAIELKDNKQT